MWMIVDMIVSAAMLLIMFATCNKRHTAGKNKVDSKTTAKAAEKNHSKRKKKDLQTGVATAQSHEGMRRGAPLIESEQEDDNTTKHLSGRESEQDGTYEDVDINSPAAKTRCKPSRRRSAKCKSKSGAKNLNKGTKKPKSKENVPIERKTTPAEDRKTSTSHGTNDGNEPKTATADSPVKQIKALRKLNMLLRPKKSDPQRTKLTTLPTQEESDQVPGVLGTEGQVPLQSLTLNKTSTQRSEMVQGEQLEHLSTRTESRSHATQRTKTLLEGTLPLAPTIRVNE
ncbi:unnamed protein product [Cylicocyclus nassatus]|uniref:Uncharacterized protein n=1 Tax=Cylicocyclus nassatus TaxID=53992 RepID=A0AA36MD22_CYLNA|nr:unnamed protein product [Cylicocyclus nassatus]